MGEKFEAFRHKLGQLVDLSNAAAVLGWDQQTYMPPGGANGRAMQLSTLQQLVHETILSDEFNAALEAARPELESLDPDSDEVRLLQWLDREIGKRRKVPAEWVGEFARVTALAHQIWEEARAKSEFALFQPNLEEIVALRCQYAAFFAPYDHVYDPLLDDYEQGMKTAEVEAVFEELRAEQVELVREIVERGEAVDDSVLHQAYDVEKQWAFTMEVIEKLGYDLKRGRQDKSAHPFTTEFGVGDVRITTRLDPNFFNTAIFSSIHEAGHAMYGQGISPALERTPLLSGASLGIHESQSRMWENLVGRSRPFWKAFFPRLKALFPRQLGDTDLETFYRAINNVRPSLIRVEADEATYNLHVMVRFELETALMEGTLLVSDLPQAWNDKMEEYLGLKPPDEAQGVLQDVHWSSGYVGYFPTYALGNLIAAQLWEVIQTDVPDLERQIEAMEFEVLLEWLNEHVHVHGAKFPPRELLERVTGDGLSAKPYLKYLREKFGEIYRL